MVFNLQNNTQNFGFNGFYPSGLACDPNFLVSDRDLQTLDPDFLVPDRDLQTCDPDFLASDPGLR